MANPERRSAGRVRTGTLPYGLTPALRHPCGDIQPARRCGLGVRRASARMRLSLLRGVLMAHLFVPGPTDVAPEILAAQTHPMIGHRSQACAGLSARIHPPL